MTPQEKKDIIGSINNNIEWDNWILPNNKYWSISQVLNCRLEWLQEDIGLDNDEHIETINMLKQVLSIINLEEIAGYED